MKNSIVCSVLFIALLASCNKSGVKEVEMSQESEYSTLKEQLVSLNANLPNNNEYVATKAKWWRYLLVAAADAGGFFLGGGVSAGAGSVTAGCAVSTLVWNLVKEEKKAETKAVIGNEIASDFNDRSIALSCVDGAGLVHNRVILDLYEDNGEELFGYSVETLIPLVAEKVAIETNCSFNEITLSRQEQYDIVNRTVTAYTSSSTIDEFIYNLGLAAPERIALLEIVEIILTGFDSINAVSDNGNYCLEVQTIIADSGISDEAKQILISTTSVANASARLWKVE